MVLSLSGALYYAYVDIEQIAANANGHHALQSKGNDVQKFTVSLTEFNTCNRDEIVISNRLYDIASYTINGDSVVISARYDAEEEGLFAKISEHFKSFTDSAYNDGNTHITTRHVRHVQVDKWLCRDECITAFFIRTSSLAEPNAPKFSSLYFEVDYSPPDVGCLGIRITHLCEVAYA